jgi:hypothetical protein
MKIQKIPLYKKLVDVADKPLDKLKNRFFPNLGHKFAERI